MISISGYDGIITVDVENENVKNVWYSEIFGDEILVLQYYDGSYQVFDTGSNSRQEDNPFIYKTEKGEHFGIAFKINGELTEMYKIKTILNANGYDFDDYDNYLRMKEIFD